jgi:hypothetical protein
MKVIKIKDREDLVLIVDTIVYNTNNSVPDYYKVEIAKPTKFLWIHTGYDILKTVLFVPNCLFTSRMSMIRYRPLVNTIEVDAALFLKEYLDELSKIDYSKSLLDDLPDQIDINNINTNNSLTTFHS